LVQVQGGAELQPAGILQYSEQLKQGTNTEIGPKNFFEIASNLLRINGSQKASTDPRVCLRFLRTLLHQDLGTSLREKSLISGITNRYICAFQMMISTELLFYCQIKSLHE
jgi:hypothetical protein